jgi:hypothetical protein
MNAEKTRKLSYRRATWSTDTGSTLQELLENAHATLKTTKERVFEYGDGMVQGMHFVKRGSISCGHIAAYVPDQHACIVPLASSAGSHDTSTQEPPDGHSYLDGDLFFAISDNDIAICPSNLRETAFLNYVHSILERAMENYSPQDLAITPVADIDQVKLIKAQGVAKITFNAILFSASMSYEERHAKSHDGRMATIVKDLQSLFSKDKELNASMLYEEANLNVRVEVSLDGRKHGIAGEESIKDIATMLLSDEDSENITITTKTGSQLRASQILVGKKVRLLAHGNSVSRLDSWDALTSYLQELSEAGITNQ